MRKFVQETFPHKHVVRLADAAPPVEGDRTVLSYPLGAQCGNCIGQIRRAGHRIRVEPVLRPWLAIVVAAYGGAPGPMGHRHWQAVLAKRGCNGVVIGGPEPGGLDILLAGPDDLWRITDLHTETGGLL